MSRPAYNDPWELNTIHRLVSELANETIGIVGTTERDEFEDDVWEVIEEHYIPLHKRKEL